MREVDENGDPVDEDSDPAQPGPHQECPGNLDGPAALQNDAHVEHEYEALNTRRDNNASAHANAELTTRAVNEFAHNLRHPDPNPPDASIRRDSVTYQQPQVMHTDGFVDMDKVKYSWARAFPTLFPPSYVFLDGAWQWAILHDISGWHRMRESQLDFGKWVTYQLWRSDGRPVAHPTFKLAVHNHKMKKSAQAQGRHAIKTSRIDPNITLNAIRTADPGSTLDKAVQELLDLAHHHVANLPGTKQYMNAKYHEMVALNFCQSYVKGRRFNLFHTGSQAEFHEYALRRVLSSYISNLDINTTLHDDMMTDDSKFAQAVQLYPQVVTHFFAAKTELWLTQVMKPLYGLEEVASKNEHAGGRGAIHFHLLGLMKSEYVQAIQEALSAFAGQPFTLCVCIVRRHPFTHSFVPHFAVPTSRVAPLV